MPYPRTPQTHIPNLEKHSMIDSAESALLQGMKNIPSVIFDLLHPQDAAAAALSGTPNAPMTYPTNKKLPFNGCHPLPQRCAPPLPWRLMFSLILSMGLPRTKPHAPAWPRSHVQAVLV